MFDVHPTAEALEEYAFDRLPEEEAAPLEEHVLVCAECQGALQSIDEYIVLMRQALIRQESVKAERPGKRLWFLQAPAWGLAAAGTVALFVFATRPRQTSSHQIVELASLRGGTGTAQVRAGDGVDIHLDLADFPDRAGGTFRIQVVDALGHELWSGNAVSSNDSKVSARVDRTLRAGTYWVRLYSGGGTLLREFGLQAQ